MNIKHKIKKSILKGKSFMSKISSFDTMFNGIFDKKKYKFYYQENGDNSTSGFEPETVAYLSLVPTLPSVTQQEYYNQFILEMKTLGGIDNFAECDRIWLDACEIKDNANISLANPASTPAQEFSSPPWTQFRGFQYGTGYRDSYYDPSIDGTVFLKDDCSILVWSLTSGVVGNTIDIGGYDGTNLVQLGVNETGGDANIVLNEATGDGQAVTNGLDLTHIRRTAPTVVEIWKNGVLIHTFARTSAALLTAKLGLGARYIQPTNQFLNKSNKEIAGFIIASGQLEPTTVYTALRNYMTNVGL